MAPGVFARILLSFPAVFTGLGAFAADFSASHVYNPNWPPHARFHNGQTMSMAIGLCLPTLWFTWTSSQLKPGARKQALLAAWIFGSLYCLTGLSAVLYPGSMGTDPEFLSPGADHFPQKWVFGPPLLINALGYWMEMRRLGKEKSK